MASLPPSEISKNTTGFCDGASCVAIAELSHRLGGMLVVEAVVDVLCLDRAVMVLGCGSWETRYLHVTEACQARMRHQESAVFSLR